MYNFMYKQQLSYNFVDFCNIITRACDIVMLSSKSLIVKKNTRKTSFIMIPVNGIVYLQYIAPLNPTVYSNTCKDRELSNNNN